MGGISVSKTKFFVFIGVISFILIFFPVVVYSYSETKPQEVFLNFYAQELVAHGAMFFAASAAAFRFITHLVEKSHKKKGFMISRRSITFILFSGILLGVVFFLGFRTLYYGTLSNAVIQNEPLSENQTLAEYSTQIREFINNKTIHNDIDNLYLNVARSGNRGIIDVRPFSILPVSVYMGFFLSFLLLFGFSIEKIKRWKLWGFFFGIPAVLGFVGVLLYLSEICEATWIIAFLIYYISIPSVNWFFKTRKKS